MTTCCWFSRHPPLEAQKQALEKLFPGHRLLQDKAVFADADDIVDRIEAVKRLYGPTVVELVTIIPLSLIQKLIGRGIKPLYPMMQEIVSDHPVALEVLKRGIAIEPVLIVPKSADYYRAHTNSCVLAPRGRVLEFVRFRRLVGINFEFEDIVTGTPF